MKRTQQWLVTALALAAAPLAWGQTAWTPATASQAKGTGPAHLSVYVGLPGGTAHRYARGAAKAATRGWTLALPDGGTIEVEGIQSQRHPNGDVTWSGWVREAGSQWPVLLTQGEHASFGSFDTPRGRYRLEGWDDSAWLVREDHPELDLPAIDHDAAPAPAGTAKAADPAPASAKADPATIDVLFLYTAGMAARYPGGAVTTRANHLAALANQAFANSSVEAVLRVAGVEAVDYGDLTSNERAIDDLRKAVLPNGNPERGLLGMRDLRSARGADLITLMRPHELELRGSCGVGYLYADTANLGLNVISDGISGWSICSDLTFAHEIGHNLGAQHQAGANDGNAGSATAFVKPGQFATLMASLGTGEPDRARTLLRFSNPQQRCAGVPCGVAGAADNAAKLRATMGRVAGYFAAAANAPAVAMPAPLDGDGDGDGVPESNDAFPFDPAHASDRDNDGVADALDRFPDLQAEWSDLDNDGRGDNSDDDIDGDGVVNGNDALPRDGGETQDTDLDGVGNHRDAFDNDRREWADTDSDGRGDNADPDVDGDGADFFAAFDLLVASNGTDRVLRLDGASGRFVAVEIAESNAPSALTARSALAWNPYRQRVDALIANRVLRYDPAARKREAVALESRRTAGVPGLRSGLPAAFTVGPDGTLYVADSSYRSLHRFDAVSGQERQDFAFGDTPLFNNAPRALQVRDGQVWAMDRTGLIAVVGADGILVRHVRPFGGGGVQLPEDATAFVFGPDGQIYVADGSLDRVQRMDPASGQLTPFVAPGAGGLDRPAGLAFDSDGRLYVSSATTHQVMRYAANGAFADMFARTPAGMLSDPAALVFVPRVADRYPKDASRRYRPVAGAWYDPAHSGQGFDIQAMGTALSVAWYTYDAQGRAVWYLATGTPQGNRLQAPLQRFAWNGSSATGTPVGSIDVVFNSERGAQLQWTLGAQSGSQSIVHFDTADSLETQFPTAIWYDPARPGWGLTVMRQGGLLAVTAFVFDADGNPTWALGTGAAGDTTVTMRRFTNGTAPATVGTVGFEPVSDTAAEGSIDLQGTQLDWRYPALDLRRFGDTPTRANGDPR